jgi:hypothetical protein
MKTHIVREAFNLDGVDYPRGVEISDRAMIARVRESHPGHVVQQHHDAPSGPPKVADKAPAPSAQ